MFSEKESRVCRKQFGEALTTLIKCRMRFANDKKGGEMIDNIVASLEELRSIYEKYSCEVAVERQRKVKAARATEANEMPPKNPEDQTRQYDYEPDLPEAKLYR